MSMTKDELNNYLAEFEKRGLYVCYYDVDNVYRIEASKTEFATESYTFKEFYDKFWATGYTKYIDDSSVPDDIPLIEEFYAKIGVEHYVISA